MSKVLQFSISPVQEFIARSRRTRDLLCSSFLLSYLSGHAMMRVIQADGTIQFPVVQRDEKITDRLLQAIRGGTNGVGPWIGSLPNRFQAEIPDDFDPNQCEKAVKDAWIQIADIIWDQVVEPVAHWGNDTDQIWERQVESFWEIHWVIGEAPDLLHRRKYWRDYVPAVKERNKKTLEEGDKCMLFSHLQELSGYTGVGKKKEKHKKEKNEREKQQEFWSHLREKVNQKNKGSQHLGERERLSAIGMIKRLLPIYAEEAIGWRFPEEAKYFPSTQVLAGLPWRKRVFALYLEKAEECSKEAEEYMKEVEEYAKEAKETVEDFKTNESAKRFFPNHSSHPWVEMDYRVIQPAFFQSKPEYSQLKEKFIDLCRKVESEPSNYYAILLMDGDQMGDLLKIYSKKVSFALADFTQAVEEVVEQLQGVLIYAGGDDVFALFPYDQVFAAAIQLREKYQEFFKKHVPELSCASISASIVLADQKTPFQQVIPYSHHQLDQIAKEKHGRNSLVVSLYNQSGEIVHWAAPWDHAICPTSNRLWLEELAKELPLSQSYLHQCKQELEPLSAVLPSEELSQVAIREWERVFQKQANSKVKEMITVLISLGLTMRYKRENVEEVGEVVLAENHRFQAAVARLIAWLRQRLPQKKVVEA